MEAKEILGLDLGDKRTGIARASSIAKLAEPLKSVAAEEACSVLKRYIAEHDVQAIAIGLPRSLSGADTAQTASARQWVKDAQQKIDVPFYWQDEALTSREARAKSSELRTKSSIDEHALAAAIILQDFLDSAEAQRTPA
ncbi:MAG TPA: Holliday junction resolvase RuvX [Candidatus Saccharimonadales bacterium]|nr:Holliday junction resolvase RuvX [Candidatus Saccharimonadales bacterium]